MHDRPTTPKPITYVKASCHCGLNEFRAGFPTSALPISNDLCHCSSCRHSSGQMAVYHVNTVSLLCADTDDPFHVDGSDGCDVGDGDGDLIAYRTSEKAVRYFCSVCSAHLFFRYLGSGDGEERDEGYWCVAAGVLERTEGIVAVGYHIWVEDTFDGGLADHFRSVGGVELPRYARGVGSERLPLGWKHPALLKAQQQREDDELSPSEDRLHFSCHCRTLQFSITRPTTSSFLPHGSYPDLIYPHDTTHLATLRNPKDAKWWLRPAGSLNPTKYFSGHCACSYCRLTSGFELQSWAYVPLANIVDPEGRPVALQDQKEEWHKEIVALSGPSSSSSSAPVWVDRKQEMQKKMPGLKQYISGPGRYREFCQQCGATAFAWRIGRPDLVCVAVALLDEQQDGARAEGWLDWCLDRVGFAEQAASPATVEGLTEGLRGVKRERAEAEIRNESPQPMQEEGREEEGTSTPAVDLREREATLKAVTLVEEIKA